MISLTRLVRLRLTFSRLNEALKKENDGLKRFHHFLCFKKHREFTKITSTCLYSSKQKPTETKPLPSVDKRIQEELEEAEGEIIEEDDYDDDDDYDEDEEEEEGEEEGLEGPERLKMFEEIAKGDSEILNKLKLLEFEIVLMKEMGVKIPNVIKKQHWEELLVLPTPLKKTEYLSFLYVHDLKRRNELEVKKFKKQKALEKISKAGFHYYGLSGHSLMYRVYDSTMKQLLNHRQLESKLRILFDCSYQEYMTTRGIRNCAKQISLCIGVARLHKTPCHVKLCNFDRNDPFGKVFPSYFDETNPVVFDECEKSYVDLYPREKLVYLSPHASEDLTEIMEDNVYIIGSYVDKGFGVKASLAKAKENNIRAARLPIDFYLAWKEGSKALTLPVVVNILLDMAYYNDWYRAFRHIPRRYHYAGVSRKKLNLYNKAEDLIVNLSS